MKTSEMIAMLEKNPKLKFTNNDNQTITVIPHKPNMFHQKTSNGCWIYYEMVIRNDWELIREPVPVWEAIKALTEGKNITCECNPCSELNERSECTFPSDGPMCPEAIKQGTWYIEEDN